MRVLVENKGFKIMGRIAQRARKAAGEEVSEETGLHLAHEQLKQQGAVINKVMEWTKASKNKIHRM